MPIRCTLTLEYKDSKVAQIVGKSVKVDDDNFISTSVTKNFVISKIQTDTPMSLLRTLNDFLKCVVLAERLTALTS